MINLVVAMDRNRVIGVDNKLPWHLPADLKRFKDLTLGHAIIMGRKTYESIGKPLPGRTNIIVTRQHGYKIAGCTVVHSLDAAMMVTQSDGEIFIIGGGDLFEQAFEFADRLYVTEIDTTVDKGHVHFPVIDTKRWKLFDRVDCKPDEKNRFSYAYLTYVKKA